MSALTESMAEYDPREYKFRLRATDAQRSSVVTIVCGALADGRLQIAEFDDRIAAVYASKTHGDLAMTIDDLVEYRSASARSLEPSDKKILPAFLLCLALGVFGAHRFYLGCRTMGIVTLLMTFSVVGAVVTIPWAFVDVFLIAAGVIKDGKGRYVQEWT